MSFENPNIHTVESNPVLIKIDNWEFKKGDNVAVVVEDGTIENDWRLKSVGGKFAVAEKINGDGKPHPIPLEEFKRIQIYEKEGDPSRVVPGHAMELRRADIRVLAEQAGIDTTQEGWEDRWNEKIRKITGV
jgi:hypothetical protein